MHGLQIRASGGYWILKMNLNLFSLIQVTTWIILLYETCFGSGNGKRYIIYINRKTNKTIKTMRKIILIKLLLFSHMMIIAQVQCEQYIQTIDSLIKAKDFYIYRQNLNSSEECQSYLLKYTQNRGYLGDTTAFYIKEILIYLSKRGTSKIIKEEAVNELLMRDYCFDVGSIYFGFDRKNFNQQAKNRLTNLLLKQYTSEEVYRYVKNDSRFMVDDKFIEDWAIHESERRNISIEEAKYSIMNTITKDSKDKLYNKKYSFNLPVLIGWLNIKECIPILEKSIQNPNGNLSVKIALARLGNKKYQQYFLDRETIDMNTAFYIGTQDLIAKYGEELYSEEKKYFMQPGKKIPIVYNVIISLQDNLLNFPKLTDESYIYKQEQIDALPPNILEDARQWMKENKGKYVINPDFSPDFSSL